MIFRWKIELPSKWESIISTNGDYIKARVSKNHGHYQSRDKKFESEDWFLC